jgi:hypothetical protein
MIPRTAYNATLTESFAVEHACSHCGARSRVTVSAEGAGRAKERLIDKDGQAAQRAHERAVKDAHETARLAVELSVCGACGKRNGQAIRRYLLRQLTTAIIVAVFFGIVGFVFAKASPRETVIAASLFGLISLAMSYAKWRKISAAARGLAVQKAA